MADSTLSILSNKGPQNFPPSLDGKVVTVAHGDLGNANTSYFYMGLAKDGFNVFSVQFVIEATTLTFEGSNDSVAIANGSATWTDITTLVTIGSPGGSVASISATGSLTVAAPLPWSRLRVKRLTTNATNALTLILTRGRVSA